MSYQQILNPGEMMGSSGAQAPILGEDSSALFQKERLRSFPEFVGLGSGGISSALACPPSVDNVQKNVSYFQLNYMVLAALILAVNILLTTKFTSWILLAALGAAWVWLIRATDESSGTLSIAGTSF